MTERGLFLLAVGTVAAAAAPWDVFSSTGTLLARARLSVGLISAALPPLVRHGSMLFATRDSFDVPVVIRLRIPPLPDSNP